VFSRRGRKAEDAASILASLRSSALFRDDLGTRPRLTLTEWNALSTQARSDWWDVGIAAIRRVPDYPAWVGRVRRLGQLGYEPAIPVLIELWTRCPVEPVRSAAAHALFEIGTNDARAALWTGFDDHEHLARFMALKVAFTDQGSPWDNVSWLFSTERLATDSGRVVAGDALDFLSPWCWSREGPSWHLDELRGLLSVDRRWLELCVSLRHHPDLGRAARDAIREADPAVTGPALDAAAAAAAARPRPRPPDIAAGSLVARYEAGDHRGVWRDVRTVDPLDDRWRNEAAQLADATMRRVRRNAEQLVAALASAGWPVEPREALPGPSREIDEHLLALERSCGAPVPPSLAAFWRIVGSIQLVPGHHAPLPAGVPRRLLMLDPIEVGDLVSMWFEVEEWEERAAGVHPEIAGPIELPISADYLHKANISGGAPYAVWLPCEGSDPIVQMEVHELPFTDYLRLAFESKGFVRLSGSPEDGEAARWLAGVEFEMDPF
jgi:hypothetical protein